MKKYLYFILLISSSVVLSQQIVNVVNITRSGNFANCSGGNPIITAEMITSDGSVVENGNLKITDPCGFTTLKITMSNLRYNQPGANWPHGFFFPEGDNITVSGVTLPAGWIPMASVTGASCSAQETGGSGFYYDGSVGSSCYECNPTTNDGNPSNNYGQSSMSCNSPFSIQFNMTFCNSKVETALTEFELRGSSDGNTGCWSIHDVLDNFVKFSINTIASEVPLYDSNPVNTEVITECINGGAEFNYIAVLEASCGGGEEVSWWTSASGGTMIGTGSPFYYDPPGQACPQGMIFYASCCPDGEGCERQPIIIGACQPPSEEPTFAPIPSQCPGLDSPLPNMSIEGATGTWSPEWDPYNTQTYTFTPDPGQCVTQTYEITIEILPEIEFTIATPDPICQGGTAPDLPDPNPFLAGSWEPAVIDTSTAGTFEYTFTPEDACGLPVTIEIVIEERIISEFDLPQHYCQGTEVIDLPSVSDNGLSGTWSPAQVDTSVVGVVTYTFTPDGITCYDEFLIEIEVEETITPTFIDVPELCQYSEAPDLPQPNEGITGTWSPSVIDTTVAGTFEYTFTPDMLCSEEITIEVTVSSEIIAEFDYTESYCQYEQPEILNEISLNGITGVWYPAVIDTSTPGVSTYTFMPEDGQCSYEMQISIEIFEQPVLNVPAPQLLCDGDFDGIYIVNLNGISPMLGGGNGTSYTYYATLADYNNNNPIPTGQLSNYQFSELPATVYVSGTSVHGCASEAVAVTFEEDEIVDFNEGPFEIEFCHGDSIDLTQFEGQLSGTPGAQYAYYNTESDARMELSQIGNPGNFTPSQNQTAAYVRIEASDNCPAIVKIDLIRHPIPEIIAPDFTKLCPGSEYEAIAESNDPDAVFEWTLEDGTVINEPNITITEPGAYTVVAYSEFGCVSETRTLTVVHPNTPIFTKIEINGDSVIVNADNGGDGPLEYSLDGVFWQNHNIFSGLIPGEIYTIWVRSMGCMTAKMDVSILDVPNFISPNGDGFNDTWTIRGIQAYQGATIKIFDRYGKIFVDRKINGSFEWDGKYMGHVVPSDDYWYILNVPATEITPEQKFVGHISVRN